MERIIAAKPLPGYRLWLRFTDGAEGVVDVSDLVGRGVFAAWNDPREFDKVFVDPECGTVRWPGDLDLDPDVLHYDLTGMPIPGADPEWLRQHRRRVVDAA